MDKKEQKVHTKAFTNNQDELALVREENRYLKQLLEGKRQLELEMKVEQEKYRIVAELIDCALWEYDIDTKKITQSRKLAGRYENNNLEIENFRETFRGWGLVHPEDLEIFEQFCDSMDHGDDFFSYDIRAFADMDEFNWIRYQGVSIKDEQGKPFKVVGITLNVDKEKRDYDLLSKKANQDPLTGLYHKKATKEQILKYINSRGKRENHALLIIDIDDFKQINDRWGHLYGDYVLEIFSKELAQLFSADIVGRIGGDEFIVFKRGTFEEDELYDMTIEAAQSLINMVHNLKLKKGHRLSVSIGISNYPKDGRTYERLFKNADIALYKAKNAGKDTYEIYNHSTDYNLNSGETRRKNHRTKTQESPDTYVKLLDEVEKRIVDFVLDVLSRNGDTLGAINTIISEIGRYYDFRNITLIEGKADCEKVKVTYEWSSDALQSRKALFEEVYNAHWEDIEKRFYMEFIFVCEDMNMLSEYERSVYKISNTTSLMQCALYDNEEIIGFIIFETNSKDKEWSQYEINTLAIVNKAISSHLLRVRSKKALDHETFYTKAVLKNQMLSNYCIDLESYKLNYINEHANRLFKNIKIGETCYKAIWGREKPCKSCPIAGLVGDEERSSVEIYSEQHGAWYSVTASKVHMPSGNEQYLICWADVTAFIARVKAKDALTGFLTLDKFDAEARRLISINHHLKYAIVYTDFNRFKNINDEWGFTLGDEVIKMFASQIANTIMEDELCCRISADRFLFLLEYVDEEKLINRLNMVFLTASVTLNEKYPQIQLTTTSGIYYIKAQEIYLKAAIDRANIARKTLKSFKSYMKHEIAVYDEKLHEQVTRRERIESSMQQALNNREFQIYMQPKVDLATRKITGAEALVRWIQPNGNIYYPGEFISLFEQNGFIGKLDFYIYEEVVRKMSEWMQEGKKVPVVSINVSRINLKDPTFTDRLVDIAERYNIPTHMIELELTENIFFENLDRLLYIINHLRTKGFLISIDDFGTGYSTLNLVQVLPVDILKLDKGFFIEEQMGDRAKTIVSNIINLAKGLGLKVIAEGVETKAQVDFLSETKCDMTQGYYFYKPLPMSDFEALLDD